MKAPLKNCEHKSSSDLSACTADARMPTLHSGRYVARRRLLPNQLLVISEVTDKAVIPHHDPLKNEASTWPNSDVELNVKQADAHTLTTNDAKH